MDEAATIKTLASCGAINAALRTEHAAIEGALQTLGDAVLAGADAHLLTEITSRVLAFCVAHFDNEEKLFRDGRYSDVEAHVAAHQGLLGAIRAACKAVSEGELEATLDVSDLLDRFQDHVVRFDRPAYAEMLQQSVEHGGGTFQAVAELDLLTRSRD